MLNTLQPHAHFCLPHSRLAIVLITLLSTMTSYLKEAPNRRKSFYSLKIWDYSPSWKDRYVTETRGGWSHWACNQETEKDILALNKFSHFYLVWSLDNLMIWKGLFLQWIFSENILIETQRCVFIAILSPVKLTIKIRDHNSTPVNLTFKHITLKHNIPPWLFMFHFCLM